jgi:hypothetical protein
MTKEDLKTALLNRDFERAQTLIAEWGSSVKSAMKVATNESELRRVFEEAQALAQEYMCLARVVRAHIAAEWDSNSGSFLYRETELERPRFRFNA